MCVNMDASVVSLSHYLTDNLDPAGTAVPGKKRN